MPKSLLPTQRHPSTRTAPGRWPPPWTCNAPSPHACHICRSCKSPRRAGQRNAALGQLPSQASHAGCEQERTHGWLASPALAPQVLHIHCHLSLPSLATQDLAAGHGPRGHKSWKPTGATACSSRLLASAADTLALTPGIKRSRRLLPGATSLRTHNLCSKHTQPAQTAWRPPLA